MALLWELTSLISWETLPISWKRSLNKFYLWRRKWFGWSSVGRIRSLGVRDISWIWRGLKRKIKGWRKILRNLFNRYREKLNKGQHYNKENLTSLKNSLKSNPFKLKKPKKSNLFLNNKSNPWRKFTLRPSPTNKNLYQNFSNKKMISNIFTKNKSKYIKAVCPWEMFNFNKKWKKYKHSHITRIGWSKNIRSLNSFVMKYVNTSRPSIWNIVSRIVVLNPARKSSKILVTSNSNFNHASQKSTKSHLSWRNFQENIKTW